jgi:hypothetical protein
MPLLFVVVGKKFVVLQHKVFKAQVCAVAKVTFALNLVVSTSVLN